MPKTVEFSKIVGAGNDFIVFDNRRGVVGAGVPRIARVLCDRRRSIGADGLLLLERSKRADFKMRILNSDGSEAEMCGNGIRCIAKFAADRGIARSPMTIETLAGLIRAEVKGDVVKARIVDPSGLRLKFALDVNGRKEEVHFINTGVPHTIRVSDALDHVDVQNLGRQIRSHKHFSPKGTNVNFIAIGPGNAIHIRTYERGVEAETLSCGTGSTASALVASALKGLRSPVQVHTRGGDTLKIYFSRKGDAFVDVHLEGKVRKSFEGRVTL